MQPTSNDPECSGPSVQQMNGKVVVSENLRILDIVRDLFRVWQDARLASYNTQSLITWTQEFRLYLHETATPEFSELVDRARAIVSEYEAVDKSMQGPKHRSTAYTDVPIVLSHDFTELDVKELLSAVEAFLRIRCSFGKVQCEIYSAVFSPLQRLMESLARQEPRLQPLYMAGLMDVRFRLATHDVLEDSIVTYRVECSDPDASTELGLPKFIKLRDYEVSAERERAAFTLLYKRLPELLSASASYAREREMANHVVRQTKLAQTMRALTWAIAVLTLVSAVAVIVSVIR